MIIGAKPIGTYVFVLKKLLEKYEQVDLTGGFNSKVIWIANRMVQWGYCTITKIRTLTPSSLEVSVKKSDDFQKLNDAFELVNAEKREVYKAKKAAEAALEKEQQEEKAETDAQTELIAMTAVEAVVEAN